MLETHPVVKKLQYKDLGQPVLILNAPEAYQEVVRSLQGEVYTEPVQAPYDFVQAFGASNEQLRELAKIAASAVTDNGLLWLCYPKKTSKTYKNSDCSRDSIAGILADEGYEPVRQIAIDEDWSALRYRKVEQIKTMTRSFATTAKGKERTGQGEKE
ncbi:DUF3052 domain-containing protein [Paenibacillus ihbetae]|uniref:DUF3052 domain-containing protein n=1 Tax=Paenibacillus ihbetae TaxID=1870820 RepID=A0A1B2E1Q4_9BACL|nr:DUF3052 domain-containing protein [Paenibacillus ihbetae]ANY73852.1 DUF3052 domain-containing protein [Paenibacillus ihbetae]